MSGLISMNIVGMPAEVFQPDAGMPAHATDFDSFADRLKEAELDYEDARADYFRTDPNTARIMEAAELVEITARTLIARALALFNMYPESRENKDTALKILDRMAKESSIREQTCCQYYRKMRASREDNDQSSVWGLKLLREKTKRMEFTNRCLTTQSTYTKRFLNDKTAVLTENDIEARVAPFTERTRKSVPEDSRFCPPRVFPPERIPADQPVPIAPEVYRRFKKIEAKDLIFNKEHYNFELPEGYVSEDGLIDSDSIVWDYEHNKVTMKYAGGIPVTWDFKQYIEPDDVPRPDEWIVEYYIRLWDQEAQEENRAPLQHFPRDEAVPDYDRIPEK